MKKFFVFFLCFVLLTGCGKGVIKEEITKETWEEQEFKVRKSLNPGGYGELSNAKIGWGLKKNVKAAPEIPEKIKEMLKKHGSFYMGSGEKELYLTFDEGYENGYTAKILDVLKEKEVPAAFFITGPYLKTEKELVRRMVKEGHTVGNHTVHHPSLPCVESAEKIKNELFELDEKFYEEFGIRMKFFRPPMGEFSERTLAITNDLGFVNVFWSFAYKDWDVKKQPGRDFAYKEITNGVHDGCILLLHAVSKDNAEVLGSVIDDLRKEGYKFLSLENLLRK